MKTLSAILLSSILLMTESHAGIHRASSTIEDDSSVPSTSRAERPASILTDRGDVKIPTEDVEDVSNNMTNISETGGGGGLAQLDPKLIEPKDPEPSWWESWWDWFASFF